MPSKHLCLACLVSWYLSSALAAAAERYPTRPIRFVVGVLPGGPSDMDANLKVN